MTVDKFLNVAILKILKDNLFSAKKQKCKDC